MMQQPSETMSCRRSESQQPHRSLPLRLRFMLSLCMLLAGMLGCLMSCSDEQPKPDELAARAAKEYYDHLVAGRYADYLAGMSGLDSIPETYREQLLVNAKQFMSWQQKEHGGISDVQVVCATADSAALSADVFLLLCYGDSVREEVVVPMVCLDGRWLMR